MGRVAKYKKVKSFDRAHSGGEYVWGKNDGRQTKKKRSKTAEKLKQQKLNRRRNRDPADYEQGGFDLPPQGKDEFDLSDLRVKKIKKTTLEDDLISSSMGVKSTVKTIGEVPTASIIDNKVKIGNQTVDVAIPKDDAEERRMTKVLNIDRKTGKSKSEKTKTIHERQEGESMRAFNKRLKEQTKYALAQDFKKMRNNAHPTEANGTHIGKREKRKEFMKNRKQKKKSMSHGYSYDESDDENIYKNDHEKQLITGENDVASLPSFLVQPEAPPTFNRLPRGATKKNKVKANGRNNGMDEDSIKAEQNAMEAMRRKVQAHYALVKAKRRKEGSFHL
jgi:hypothetical protein